MTFVIIDDAFINKLIELTKCNKITWSRENGMWFYGDGYRQGKPYYSYEDCQIYEHTLSYELIFDNWNRKEYKWSKNKLVKELYDTIKEQRLQKKISKSTALKEDFMNMKCPERIS